MSDDLRIGIRIPPMVDKTAEALDFIVRATGHVSIDMRVGWLANGGEEFVAAVSLRGSYVSIAGPTAALAVQNLAEALRRLSGQ